MLSSLPRSGLSQSRRILWASLAVVGPLSLCANTESTEANFSARLAWPDYVVVAAYLLAMVGIGWWLSVKEEGKQDFFRGGRRIPFWASGLSLFATGASAISLMAMPGMAFANNWTYFTVSLYTLLSLVVVLVVYVPLARRLDVKTANEYLERRFHPGFRFIGTVIYSLNQILARMAAIMLLPALALEVVVGIPIWLSILLFGGVTTVYATMGGLEGVVWTDVIQALGMLVAVGLCTVWAISEIGINFTAAWSILEQERKLEMFDLSWNFLEPTVIVIFANSFFTVMATIGDQNFIQRIQCTPSERDARKAVLTQMFVALPLNFALFSLGTLLFLFYFLHPQDLPADLQNDAVFPVFATQNLPVGVAGVVIAAIFAATMSTLSSALNSTANLVTEDLFARLAKRPFGESDRLRLGRRLTLALGVFGTLAALWLAYSDFRSVWDLMIMLTGMILGPMAGVFLLGVFTRSGSAKGALCGFVLATVVAFFCRELTAIHHFLYLPVGVTTAFATGYIFSLILPSCERPDENLTVFSVFAAGAKKDGPIISE